MQNLNFLKTFCAVVALLLVGFMIQSCGDCSNVTCQNGGTCTDGVCSCPTGYDGTNCELVTCALADVCYVNSTCEADPTTGAALCVCNAGWEGDTCGVKTCDRLVGTYASTGEVCINQDGVSTTYPPYNPSVTCSATVGRFIIGGFGGFDTPAVNIGCIIEGPTSWIIDDTTFTSGTLQSITHSTTGTIATVSGKSKLNIDYRVRFADNTYEDCDMEMTQQ